MPKQKLFLERRSYRMRRLMDAVRLMPVLGLGLWMVPLMWPHPDEPGGSMSISAALTYLFGVWFLLIVVALALWVKTRRFADKAQQQPLEEMVD